MAAHRRKSKAKRKRGRAPKAGSRPAPAPAPTPAPEPAPVDVPARRRRARREFAVPDQAAPPLSAAQQMHLARRATARTLLRMGDAFRDAMACAFSMDAGEVCIH
jgi:hypothetical protein